MAKPNTNIYEFAMQMEKDGEAYYRGLAEKCNSTGLKQIINLLAEDEVNHFNTFNQMKIKSTIGFTGSDVLKNARNIFVEIREKENVLNLDLSGGELYKKAIDIEKKSERFYREKADEVEDPNARTILLQVAEDEIKHQFLLERILDFLERPLSWLENAEFNHLDSY